MMKSKNIFWMTLVAIFMIATACEDAINKEAFLSEDPVPGVLQNLTPATVVLTKDNEDENFPQFNWTRADYGFKASVTYTIQIDAAGNEFADAVDVLSSSSLSATVTVGQFNDYLMALGLAPEESAEIEIRLKSNVIGKIAYSNVVSATVTPYATIFPSIWGMGAALKGWGPWPANAVEWPSQEFKKYEQIAYFTNGQAFRFFEQLDWNPTSYNYPFFTSVSAVFENAGDGDSNLKVAAATGWYLVKVDLIAKTVTATATTEPLMYMTGAGIGGWDQPGTGASIKMTYLRPGVFFSTATFYSGEAFRFFAQADWGPTSYNYPYFTTVDPLFVNAADGDSNLKYVGTTGVRTVLVDVNNKTVVVAPPLYMTGAGIGGWDQPGTGASIKMTYVGPDTYESTATFYNGEAFRFFAQADWGPTSYNYPYFSTVSSDFVNANDGDSNLKYVGTTGSRTVRVNIATKVVTLN